MLEVIETADPSLMAAKKSRGNFGLDVFNICAADIRDGLGPYLTIFLLSKNWTPSAIGWALSSASFAALLATAPAGFLIDQVSRKRLVIALASIVIALTTIGIWFSQSFWVVIALQVTMGLASSLIGPAIAFLSRLISGSEDLPKRIGRNEIFNHAGNFAAASLSAALVNLYNVEWIFGLVVFMSISSIYAIFRIPASKGFHVPTLNLTDRKLPRFDLAGIKSVLLDSEVVVVLITAFLFQFANASLLPIMAQVRSVNPLHDGVEFLSIGIVIAQLTSIPAAWFAGSFTKRFSAHLCLAIGISAVAVRALIFHISSHLLVLEAAQILDGVAAGVIAVAPIVAIFRVAEGRGNYGFLAGVLAMFIGLGATLSSLASGYTYQYFGSSAYFYSVIILSLTALALIGLDKFRAIVKAL